MKPSPTLQMIATACGVGAATVSRALNGRKRCSPATRKRILATAKKLGYRPDPAYPFLLAAAGHTALTPMPSHSLGVSYASSSLPYSTPAPPSPKRHDRTTSDTDSVRRILAPDSPSFAAT